MQSVEIIRFLASRGKIKMVLENLAEIIGDFQDAEGKREITVHSREVSDMDLLVSIRWEQNGQPSKSREGFLLAEYLRDFGLVHHEIWKQEWPASPGVDSWGSGRKDGRQRSPR